MTINEKLGGWRVIDDRLNLSGRRVKPVWESGASSTDYIRWTWRCDAIGSEFMGWLQKERKRWRLAISRRLLPDVALWGRNERARYEEMFQFGGRENFQRKYLYSLLAGMELRRNWGYVVRHCISRIVIGPTQLTSSAESRASLITWSLIKILLFLILRLLLLILLMLHYFRNNSFFSNSL